MTKTNRIGKNANEIYSTEYPDIAWIVPGLLPSGLAFLGGRPKAGKSWLTMQIAQSMGCKNLVLGHETTSGRVLYLALEDGERRLKQRMQIQGWNEKARKNVDFLTIETFTKTIGFLHENNNAKKLYSLVKYGKYKMVVIDSFNVAFMGLKNVDDSPVMTAALKPLQNHSLEANILTMVIDHHNKLSVSSNGNQSPIDNIQNSTAKSSVSDTALGVYKLGKGQLRLMATGRDIEDIDIKILADNNMHYQYEGQGKVSNKEQEVLDAIISVGNLVKMTDVSKALNIPKSRASERLNNLFQEGYIERDSETKAFYIPKNGKKPN